MSEDLHGSSVKLAFRFPCSADDSYPLKNHTSLDPGEGLNPQVRVRAFELGADAGGVLLDLSIRGLNAWLERLAIDLEDAGWLDG